MIVLQFKGRVFISCIQEEYKLTRSLSSTFNTLLDLKLPKQSSKFFI